MIVRAGQQHAPRRRAIGRCMEIGELNPLSGETIDILGKDFAAVGAEIRIAHVVGEDEQNVGPRGGVRLGRAEKPDRPEQE
jgi:hypothetical protein